MNKIIVSLFIAVIMLGCKKVSQQEVATQNNTSVTSGTANRTGTTSNLQWQKCFGSSADEYVYSIAAASDGTGYFVAGYTAAAVGTTSGNVSGTHGERDAWVVKTDLNGNFLWQLAIGGSARDEANAVAATPDGGCLIAGDTYSTDGDLSGIINRGSSDGLIAKISSSGQLEWVQTFGASGSDNILGLTATNDGQYAFTGWTGGAITSVWLVKFSIPTPGTTGLAAITAQSTYSVPGSTSNFGYALGQSADGGFTITGNTYNTYVGLWIINTNSDLSVKWDKQYGNNGENVGFSVTNTLDNNVLITGRANNNCIVWKLAAATGSTVWQTILSAGGTSGAIFGRAVVSTSQGDIIVGSTSSKNGAIIAVNGSDDVFAAKLDDATGKMISSNVFGGKNNDIGKAVLANSDGTFTITANTNSNNGDVSGNHGAYDYWVLKFKYP